MNDIIWVSVVLALVAFLLIAGISILLNYFVALQSPPALRAGWTVGVAYVLAAIIFTFGFEDFKVWAPLIALPGALAVFLYWYLQFRYAWLENLSDLPEGVGLAESDWLKGLIRVSKLIVIVVLAGVSQYCAESL